MPCLSTYSSSAQSAHVHIHSPRERARLKGHPGSSRSLWCAKITFHPSVMCHPLQHLSLSTSTRSLSPTSPIFQSFSPSQSHSLVQNPYPCADPRQSGGSNQIPSPTWLKTFCNHVPCSLFVKWTMVRRRVRCRRTKNRESPTLSTDTRAIVLQLVASRRFRMTIVDVKSAFLVAERETGLIQHIDHSI